LSRQHFRKSPKGPRRYIKNIPSATRGCDLSPIGSSKPTGMGSRGKGLKYRSPDWIINLKTDGKQGGNLPVVLIGNGGRLPRRRPSPFLTGSQPKSFPSAHRAWGRARPAGPCPGPPAR